MVFLFEQNVESILTGSFIMLLLMGFAWLGAIRSTKVLLVSVFFLFKALILFTINDASFFAFFIQQENILSSEVTLYRLCSLITLIAFTCKLLGFNKQSRHFYSVWGSIVTICITLLLINLLLGVDTSWQYHQIINLFVVSTLLILTYKNKQTANVSIQLFFNMLLAYLLLSLLNTSFYIFQVSQPYVVAFEVISLWCLIALACYLIGRSYFLYVENEKNIQQQLLASLAASKSAQDELLTIQQESQEQLEQNVQERTLELNIALQELEEANQELRERNTKDELTGLFNRRHYDQKIVAEYRRSRRNLTPLSLIVVDIDYFKNVNDNYGHLAGDRCLKEVAKLMTSQLHRSSDIGFRYGGEEFCLILPETTHAGATSLAESLRKVIESQVISFEEHKIGLTISCGVATYEQEKNITPEKIFACADLALYQAKQAGRNRVLSGNLKN